LMLAPGTAAFRGLLPDMSYGVAELAGDRYRLVL
jgi:hypothetical protein